MVFAGAGVEGCDASVARTSASDELTALYLDGLDDSTRAALDAASVVRRTTLSLLEAMLPERAPLRALPFVQLGHDGLVVHDTVREIESTPADGPAIG